MRHCSNGHCVIMRLLRNGDVDGMRKCYRKSFGHDLIFNKLIKLMKFAIVIPLTITIHRILSAGIFLGAMKLSKVIQLFKKMTQLT